MMEENDEIYLFPFRLAALDVYMVDNMAAHLSSLTTTIMSFLFLL
jgi:hypothetical protein